MKKQPISYETIIRITTGISHSRDPAEVVLMTVEGIKTALDAKGCALFLINRKTRELEIAALYGLSDEYIYHNLGQNTPKDYLPESIREQQKEEVTQADLQEGAAPPAALEMLRANPETAEQFKATFGYLPEGF